MYVAIDSTRREDKVFARDGVCRCARNKVGIYAAHNVGIARLAYAGNLTILDTHIGLHDADHRVDDGYVGDDHIECAIFRGDCIGQSHTVAQCLTSAIYHLVAIAAT